MKHILLIGGARPNFMKLAPVVRAMRSDGRVEPRFVHTGQHYDPALSGEIMRDLELPEPDVQLGIGSGNISTQLAQIIEAVDALLDGEQPAAVLVVGDVTSTLGAGLPTANRGVPLIHVEAGLRSFDWTMPEERNRVLVDRLSQHLFVTEPSGVENLEAERCQGKIHLVGNVMIDSLLRILDRARASDIRSRLDLGGTYSVMTLHRPANVDALADFEKLIVALAPLAAEAPLVFPVHPRTRSTLEAMDLPAGFRCIEPLGYLDFIGLVDGAALVLTDSGGLQEETTVLGRPCLTLRQNTERPITISVGSNELVYNDARLIADLGKRALAGEWKESRVPDLWDGHAGERIATVLGDEFG